MQKITTFKVERSTFDNHRALDRLMYEHFRYDLGIINKPYLIESLSVTLYSKSEFLVTVLYRYPIEEKVE